MKLEPAYPNPEHKATAEANTGPFISDDRIDAVLRVNACDRADSCLDIVTLARPEAGWNAFEASKGVYTCRRVI